MARIALITGANRGLGFETARQLSKDGATSIIGARDPQQGERAAAELRAQGLDVDWVALDVTSESSVKQAAERVRARHGVLDILVNNAGILPEASAGEDRGPVDVATFRETFDTNVIGTVRVIEQFLPLLRESDAGRIVNVSTTMGSLTDQLDPSSPYYQLPFVAYRSSKTALNGITVGLSKLLADTAIKVNSICPGSVQTDLAPGNREQAPLTTEEGSRIVVEMAGLPDDGPTGTFVDRDGTVAW
jgi:NAD(P)-dependent dehydrogenase (short-subunit alcohol dehydrogenase family)